MKRINSLVLSKSYRPMKSSSVSSDTIKILYSKNFWVFMFTNCSSINLGLEMLDVVFIMGLSFGFWFSGSISSAPPRSSGGKLSFSILDELKMTIDNYNSALDVASRCCRERISY